MSNSVGVASMRFFLSLCGLGVAVSCSPQANSGKRAAPDAPSQVGAASSEAPKPSAVTLPAADNASALAIAPRADRSRPPLAAAAARKAAPVETSLIRVKRPVPVLGRFWNGRLEMAGGCLIVVLAENKRAATPVFPPNARLLYRDGRPIAVSFGVRTISIGRNTRIPGGGSVSAQNLTRPLPTGCPRETFTVGG